MRGRVTPGHRAVRWRRPPLVTRHPAPVDEALRARSPPTPPPLPPPTSRALLPCNHVSLGTATFVISRRRPDVGRKQFHLMDGHKRGRIGWRGELCTTGRNRCPDRLLQIVPSPSLRHRVTSWLTVENFFFPGLLLSARGPVHSRATCPSS